MAARVGHVSATGDENYRDAVTYVEDNAEEGEKQQDNVTQELYFAIPCGTVKPPNADDQVLVAHLESGQEVGIILGRVGSEKFCPPEWFCGLFLQAFSRAWDKCYVRYTDPDNDPDENGNDGKYLFHNEDDSRFESKNLEFEADEKLTLDAPSVKITGDSIEISAGAAMKIKSPQGDLEFSAGDVAAALVSLVNHPHNTFALANAGGPVAGTIGPPTPIGG